ncbi:MAG: hypothetical protein HOQ03_02880 [Thermoleophilia bacterium]|nr:hypothetical protein [Thermoleophilia bacterium]
MRLLLGAIAVALLAGCDTDRRRTPAATPAETRSSGWVEAANDACRRQVPAIERAGEPIPRAVERARRGAPGGWKTVAKHMRRQADGLSRLYEDLKAIPRPRDDRRIRRFLYLYANVAGSSFRAVDGMLYDRAVAEQYVADSNAAGEKAHAVARELGTEACTSWLVAS